MKERIEKAVKEALGTDAPFVVERPRALGHGDYSTNAALVGKADPHELSSKLRSLLGSNEVEKIEVVGKFVNFYLSREALIPKEQKILQSYAGKTIMVEYTDPNPFKEFHIGHLMSNAIGESIARLLESSGARVIRANYQGDVGPHVAKAIWGKMQKPGAAWGEAYAYGAAQYEAHQEEIDAINKKVYERSDETINLGLAEIKKETAPFDTSITVTANEQSDYFKVVFEALGRVHPEWQGQFTHVSHGMMRFAQGKMSSRTGNVITGESLLEDLTKAARGREDVAVGAIKYTVLKS